MLCLNSHIEERTGGKLNDDTGLLYPISWLKGQPQTYIQMSASVFFSVDMRLEVN